MGTAIRDSSVSRESMSSAEKELEKVRTELATTRQRVSVAANQYQLALKSVSQLELDIAKIKMEVSMVTETIHTLLIPDARFILPFLRELEVALKQIASSQQPTLDSPPLIDFLSWAAGSFERPTE